MNRRRILIKEFVLFLKTYAELTWHIFGIQLGILLLILILSGLFAFIEKIAFGSSVYFAFITALTVGYGDILAHTTLGRIISVLIGYLGITLFGILIAVATEAVRRTIGPDVRKVQRARRK